MKNSLHCQRSKKLVFIFESYMPFQIHSIYSLLDLSIHLLIDFKTENLYDNIQLIMFDKSVLFLTTNVVLVIQIDTSKGEIDSALDKIKQESSYFQIITTKYKVNQ